MPLEIESPEELEVAEAAVAKFRKDRVRHVGKHARRYTYPCEQSSREQVLAEEWQKTNNPPSFLNGGIGTLEWLLCTDEKQRLVRELTPEEATAVASAIQWLGTNCGWCWLEDTVEKCGYRIVRADKNG